MFKYRIKNYTYAFTSISQWFLKVKEEKDDILEAMNYGEIYGSINFAEVIEKYPSKLLGIKKKIFKNGKRKAWF